MGSERAESVADAPPPEEWEADDAADSEATERLDGLRRWAGEEDSGEATEGAALAREAGEAPNGGRGGRWLLAGGGVRPAIPLSLSSSFLGMERELLCLAALTTHELPAYTIRVGILGLLSLSASGILGVCRPNTSCVVPFFFSQPEV